MTKYNDGAVSEDSVERLSIRQRGIVRAALHGKHILTNYDAPFLRWEHDRRVFIDGSVTLEDLRSLVEVMEAITA